MSLVSLVLWGTNQFSFLLHAQNLTPQKISRLNHFYSSHYLAESFEQLSEGLIRPNFISILHKYSLSWFFISDEILYLSSLKSPHFYFQDDHMGRDSCANPDCWKQQTERTWTCRRDSCYPTSAHCAMWQRTVWLDLPDLQEKLVSRFLYEIPIFKHGQLN